MFSARRIRPAAMEASVAPSLRRGPWAGKVDDADWRNVTSFYGMSLWRLRHSNGTYRPPGRPGSWSRSNRSSVPLVGRGSYRVGEAVDSELARSNSPTAPDTVSMNLFSATPFRPSHIDKAAAVDGASTERVPNGLTAIRIKSRVRLGPVSPDPSLSLMPQQRRCNASL